MRLLISDLRYLIDVICYHYVLLHLTQVNKSSRHYGDIAVYCKVHELEKTRVFIYMTPCHFHWFPIKHKSSIHKMTNLACCPQNLLLSKSFFGQQMSSLQHPMQQKRACCVSREDLWPY